MAHEQRTGVAKQPKDSKSLPRVRIRGSISDRGKLRRKLFDKDPTCGICLLPIPHFENSTLDHIIPKHYGGATSIYNLRLAHKRCNHDRGHQNVPYYSSDLAHHKADTALSDLQPSDPNTNTRQAEAQS